MKTRWSLALGFASLLLVGCDQALQNFVDVKPPIETPNTQPILTTPSNGGFKISPGIVDAAGSTLGASMTITPSSHKTLGSTVGFQGGLSQSGRQ